MKNLSIYKKSLTPVQQCKTFFCEINHETFDTALLYWQNIQNFHLFFTLTLHQFVGCYERQKQFSRSQWQQPLYIPFFDTP